MVRRALLPAVLAALAISISGCFESRFPACKDSSECAPRDGGPKPVCYNLRCVDCQYDTDCPSGQVCSGVNVCQSIDSRVPDNGQPEAASWDECASRCKDKPCVAACDQKFKK